MNTNFSVGDIITNDADRSAIVVTLSDRGDYTQVGLAEYDGKWNISTICGTNPDYRVTGQVPVDYARSILASYRTE